MRLLRQAKAGLRGAGANADTLSSDTPAYDYVFVFTYGRSGSTLLMGYLNSLPGYCIRGENHNILAHLCAVYKAAKDTGLQVAKKSMEPVHPWYGADLVDLDRVRRSLRTMFVRDILNPTVGAGVVGCKEIRINCETIPDFDAFLSSVEEIFGPKVRFIFNHRNVSTTALSGWWKDTTNASSLIQAMDDRLRGSRYSGTGKVFHVEYEKLIESSSHAMELAAFLAAPFSERDYEIVMAQRHSY